MTAQPSFKQQLLQGVEFILPEPVIPTKTIPICETNEVFQRVCAKLVEDTRNNLNEVSVHLALLTLQEKFFSCFALAPRACRRHMFSDKVICLFHSYRETHRVLHELRLLTNPIHFREEMPPPAQVTNIVRYEGFAIGGTIDLNEEEA